MAFLWYTGTTTFGGFCPGAVHHYPRLERQDGLKVRIVRIMTEEDAAALNDLDGNDPDQFVWRAGSTTNRFDGPEDALRAAQTVWRVMAEPNDGLIIAYPGMASPPDDISIVDGPRGFINITTVINHKANLLNWYEHGDPYIDVKYGADKFIRVDREEGMRAVEQHWDAVLKLYGFNEPHTYQREELEATVRRKENGQWLYLDPIGGFVTHPTRSA